ncbi:type II toxin-antitoxin system VapC family toxin [bacterium]|nr:MAG: type II toxin-antitoxin system VapC family toxin [bacterium]
MAKGGSGRSSAEMERVVIDTNIYVDWLNEGQHEVVLFQREAVKYLSAVVLMELSAGAFSARDRRLVREVTSAFAKVGRILVPTVTIYEEAGDVLRRLQESRGYTVASAYGLANDVLIALSARSIGATVITQNQRDFVAIQTIRPFKLALAPHA